MFDGEDENRNRHLSLGDRISKRQAQRQLKASVQYVEMMRNRLKVLASQAEHHNSRSKNQTEKIEKHLQLQEESAVSREKVTESLHSRKRGQIGKMNKEKQKQEKQKTNQLLQQLQQLKMHRGKLLKQSSQCNRQLLARRKQIQLQEKRSKRRQVINMQTIGRQTVDRYNRQKLEDITNIRNKEKHQCLDYSSQMMKQFAVLVEKQKELTELSQESITNSRLLNQHFNHLYAQKCHSHFQLPSLNKSGENANLRSN